MYHRKQQTDWNRYLTDFERAALERITGKAWLEIGDYVTANPITEALSDGVDLVATLQDIPGFGKRAMARLATLCQMAVYDAWDGPERDGKAKGLRRHWYAWFKVHFAQPISALWAQHGDKKESEGFDGTAWAARLSVTYGLLVDRDQVTYKQLWVEDTSRMIQSIDFTLFRSAHFMVTVEKDSIFHDYTPACKALGASVLVSGKGKMSKAATEKVLRDVFRWREDYDPFTHKDPLVVLHLSDHDADGEAVIGPTFGEQARRYTPHVREARIGIKPESVEDWTQDWYDVKTTNKGYISWAQEKALFMAQCSCGAETPVQGVGMYGTTPSDPDYVPHTCPRCQRDMPFIVTVKKPEFNLDMLDPKGFEVEALPSRAYYKLFVRALLECLPFEYILEKLRDECKADHWQAAQAIQEQVLEENESYQKLLSIFDQLEEVKGKFERKVRRTLEDLGEPHKSDWRDEEDDPKVEDFEEHVYEAGDWARPWRPFSQQLRTDRLIEFLEEEHEDTIQAFVDEVLEWDIN